MSTYLVTVFTSNILQAGTDANVYIELIGRKESSGKIKLENSKTNSNKFEQGKSDLFEIKCNEIGTLKKIKIGHDNKGFGPGWHLNKVLIESLSDGRFWLCECNRWLDKKEDDHLIERELIAIEQPNPRLKDIIYEKENKLNNNYTRETLDYTSPRKKNYFNDNECVYKITVITSDLKYAGTDANVFIKIYGKKLETEKIPLKQLKNNKKLFEAGSKDEFEITTTDVEDIKKITIGHDNKGIGPGWHLKEVIIEKLNGDKWVFPCNKWFDKKEDDRLIERDILPLDRILNKTDRVHNYIGSILNYDVFVKTSDIQNAGTDANVFIKIYGQYRKSEYIELKKSLTNRNKFEKGNTDQFSLKEEFFGEIIKIKVKHDNTGIGPDWHLNEVMIESADLGRRWVFVCNKWLAKNGKDSNTEIELYSIDNKLTMTDSNLKKYKIEVFTGDLPKSGTDANVYMTLFGEENESPETHLNKSKTHRNKFERNNMDSFVFETYDLGKLVGIRVRHDNTGIYPEWYLDRVEIRDEITNEKYLFKCEKWFAKGIDDCKIDRIIEEINYKKKPDKKDIKPKYFRKKKDKIKPRPPSIKIYKKSKEYYVKFYTGEKQLHTGTDLNASIRLFGDNQVSKEFRLKDTKTHQEKFFKNQIDLFEIESDIDLGTLYALELKFEQCLKTSNDLHLKKIDIQTGDLVFRFDFDQMISIKNSEHGIEKVILLENTAQFF